MMVNLMRSNQRWLMIIISAVVIVSFVWFYSDRSQMDRTVSDRVGSLYGQGVSGTDLSRIARRLEVAYPLGTYDVYRGAMADGYDQQNGPINYLVLEHEAEKFGIHPSDDEVRAAGERLPAFQGPTGSYDPQRNAEFIETQLNYRGLGPNQVDELVRMNLIVERLRAIITATVVVTPQEVRTRYEELYSNTDASVVRLKAADYAAVPEPTEDEIKKYFNDQKDRFKQPERRQVQYVKFGLDDAQQKLQGRERMAALKPLADQAADLLGKLLDQKADGYFATTAGAESLAVHDTPEFEAEQATGFPEAALPGFTQAAFKLSKTNPDSDVPLDTPTAFYDLHLVAITPERPLTIEEARPKIVAAIKDERAGAALTTKAEEVRAKISDAMKAGQPFAAAVKATGLAAEDLAPFSLAELNRETPELREVADIAAGLPAGELSKFNPDKDGGFFVYVRGRVPADEAKFAAAKSGFTTRLQTQKSTIYFREWLRASREEAKPKFNVRFQS